MLYALSFVLCGGVAALRGPTQHAERSRILADAWWQSADLPSGPNKAPPAGYKPIAGSGKCMCRGGGNGLDSCGTLCCDASPYTDPDPSGQYYVGTRGGMCYEPCDGSEGGFDQWWKDPCLGLPYGPNNAAPAGYKAIAGAGTCNCRGSGNGLDSCGTLCCAASPYTDPDPSGTYYAGKSATVRVDWHGDGACGTPGTNLGKAFTSVQECGEAAAQRDPSCKRIQWSEDYNNLWGCSCCVDGGGTDGDGNIYYKVYEITGSETAGMHLMREGYFCNIAHLQTVTPTSGQTLERCKAACAAVDDCKFISYSISDPTGGYCYGYSSCDASVQKVNGGYNIYRKAREGGSSSKKNSKKSSTTVIIVCCVVAAVVLFLLAYLVRARRVAAKQHHRASMPDAAKDPHEAVAEAESA